MKTCTAPRCAGKFYAKGLCKRHHTQVSRHGRLTPEREQGAVRVCTAPGCERTDAGRLGEHGVYCRKHARQIRTHGKLTPEREHVMGRVGCQEPRCRKAHRAGGYCQIHYNARRWQAIKAALAKYPGLGTGA